jgi:hypothetical protein
MNRDNVNYKREYFDFIPFPSTQTEMSKRMEEILGFVAL